MSESKESAMVDFANLITLALGKCLAWNSLSLIVDKMTLSEDQSKKLIKVLLKQLQQIQGKLEATKDSFQNDENEPLQTENVDDLDQSIQNSSENEDSVIEPEDPEINVDLKYENENLANEHQLDFSWKIQRSNRRKTIS